MIWLLRLTLRLFSFISLFLTSFLLILRLQPPQSHWLAFHSERDGNYEIYRMYPNGSQVERLTTANQVDVNPTWSANNTALAFITTRSSQDIYVLNFEQDEARPVMNNYLAETATWSPDGEWIAFVTQQNSNQELYRIQIGTETLQRLTDSFGSDNAPSWSPDGKRLIFASGRDLDWELYLLDLSCEAVDCPIAQPQRLTNHPGYDAEPAWSPDGEWIAFTGFENDRYQIFKMRLDGSERQQLTSGNFNNQLPDWSADGQWLAFVSDRDGNREIYRMRADGSQIDRLTHDPKVDDAPAWSAPINISWRGGLMWLISAILCVVTWQSADILHYYRRILTEISHVRSRFRTSA